MLLSAGKLGAVHCDRLKSDEDVHAYPTQVGASKSIVSNFLVTENYENEGLEVER